jgi:hypothetical protein
MDRSAFKMGCYGAGALWCLKEREGKYITFNNVRIARQEKDGTWMAVEPGWTVTKTGPVDVRVQHDGREGWSSRSVPECEDDYGRRGMPVATPATPLRRHHPAGKDWGSIIPLFRARGLVRDSTIFEPMKGWLQ